ncbi:response regulator [Roseivirga sp. UBA1976]|jgi:CheY-like chemotaxis protein|uniref:response regulator n=1 Tax=Roseivirga sp. UBA1976 TaxID=1947386 RepID=UPI00257ED0BF|nr:response regulator [Roseivirga sp. UBA1976]MEC7756089.1 response regulator [Bacteroidota bacterium]|tara:strand:- start:638 stop:1039 length:402 start_codon:yes stop_codon:yes gene_type:complete
MEKKLKCILLVDDDAATNFLNSMVVEEAECCERCVVAKSGMEALEFLKSSENGEYPQPDLIFLDINMPGMNGWQFLEHYEKLHIDQKAKVIIVMLTTSLNPDDLEKSKSTKVEGFIHKPLTEEILKKIIDKNF